MKKLQILTLSAATALLAVDASAQQSVGINIDTGSIDSTTLGGAPDVRQDNWNAFGSVSSFTNLVDDSGTLVPGLTISSTATGRSQRGNTSGLSNDELIFSSVVDITGSSTFSVTGITFDEYDVYVYMHDDANDRAGSFTIDSTTYYMKGIGGSEGVGDPDSTGNGYVLSTDTTVDLSTPNTISVENSIDQGNYVVFSGLTATSFDLIAAAIDTSDPANRNKFAGLQIVAVPEPSSYALLGVFLALGAILVRRRA